MNEATLLDLHRLYVTNAFGSEDAYRLHYGAKCKTHKHIDAGRYLLKKAEERGLIVRHDRMRYVLTEAGKVWCGLVAAPTNVANT